MGWLTWLCTLLCSTGGDVTWTSGYANGLEAATRRSVPLVVFVHGSDWNRLGERLDRSVWRDRRMRSILEGSKPDIDAVFTDVDVLQSPTPRELEAFETANAGWKKQGLVTYPAFIALLPDGTVLGSRQGETLPRTPEAAQEALIELARSASISHDLRVLIAEAAAAGRTTQEVQWIHQLMELPLDQPTAHLERLSVIDPEDASGIRRRASMPTWHTMIADATKDAKEGRGAEALARLEALLEDPAYTDAQRARVFLAIGSVHRNTEAPKDLASAAFKSAWSLDPDGVAGNAGMRWYLRFYSDPTLLFGWSPEQCSTELVTWEIEDLPTELEAGTWTFTADYTKGRHRLEIVEVALIDGAGRRVAVDSHEGFTGTRDQANTWQLELPRAVEEPRLQVRCRSDGGTDSHGTLLFRQLSSQ
jgi:hypothetical protein